MIISIPVFVRKSYHNFSRINRLDLDVHFSMIEFSLFINDKIL